jgi:thiosulfate reductase cytochrome b subunit
MNEFLTEFLVMFAAWVLVLTLLNWAFRAHLRRRMRGLRPPCKSCDRDKVSKQYQYVSRMWRQS